MGIYKKIFFVGTILVPIAFLGAFVAAYLPQTKVSVTTFDSRVLSFLFTSS